MERKEIRYHPLIDDDTEGTEKVPLFVTSNTEGIHSMYLSEMILGYFRLRSKQAVSLRASDKQAEIEKKNDAKAVSQKMFKVV